MDNNTLPRIEYSPQTAKNIYGTYFKRPLEFLIALGLIVLFSPLIAGIALGITLFYPGPVFFRQERIGKNGKPFTMLKFRSMQVGNSSVVHREHVQRLILENADPKSCESGTYKLKHDPRITGLGRILRKLSLDEIPQLFNVLKGDMALVGPRPPLPYEYEVYSEWHTQRLAVAPGLTGLWQVKFHNTVCFDDMVRIDLHYIQTMSLSGDLKLMLLTPIAMIEGKGAG